MFCPQCESEYVDGVERCPDCDVALTDAVPRPRVGQDSSEPVSVLVSVHAEAIAVGKSILIDAGIPFGIRNEEVQDLFGYGRFPTGNSLIMGRIEMIVPAEHAEVARVLLAGLQDNAPEAGVDLMTPDADEPSPVRSLWALARPAGRVVGIVMLASMFVIPLLALASNYLSGWIR